MKMFNKYEKLGIALSIVLMVFVLSILKIYTNFLNTSQVFVSNDSSQTDMRKMATNTEEANISDLEKTLRDAHSVSGELVKLVIDDVRLGAEGEPVKSGDTVVVHYVGTLQDGTKFDSSYDRGQPFTFTIGKGIVIKGWEEGLIGMKVGGRRILVIPSDMAYGNKQVGTIPPNTPLIFAVELLEIKK